MPQPDYLTEQQYQALRRSLAPFARLLERVDVYGSRARGTHRPGSDIDLIVLGPVQLEDLLRIAVALDESDLSISADVTRYSEQLSPAFTAEVARDARPLFTQAELFAAQAEPVPARSYRDWWDAPDDL